MDQFIQMSMSISPQVNVKHCHQCRGNLEYQCRTCGYNLCRPCKRTHVISLDTKHHDVVLFNGNFKSLSNSETCVAHPGQVFEKYCETCDLPICCHCKEHRQHILQSLEYYCLTCGYNLCRPCKRSHEIELDTKHHDVMLYSGKFKSLAYSKTCVTHPGQAFEKYCETCDLPICCHCKEHRQHNVHNFVIAYEKKRHRIRDTIINIRGETLFRVKLLQTMVEKDVIQCRKKIVNLQSAMLTKSMIIKRFMKSLLIEIIVKYKFLLVQKLQKQILIMNIYLTTIRNYEQRYEQLANTSVKFLKFIKNARLPKIHDTPHQMQRCMLSFTQEINMEALIELLSKIQITDGGTRETRNEDMFKLTPIPVLQKFVTVEEVDNCLHISFVTPDRVWVSDNGFRNKLIFKDTTTSVKIYCLEDALRDLFFPLGLHTVNIERELIYIDKYSKIKKFSNDRKSITTFIKKPDSTWRPLSVYCSPSTGDLLVAMYKQDTNKGQARRYNNIGEHKQTIPHDNTPRTLYVKPHYLTENSNGDVVVSDWYRGVVVTERGGRHRFSYTKTPSGSRLHPRGICTDALSHILVCDLNTDTVQMISKDGEFMSYLLTSEYLGMQGTPRSLGYDITTHLLWVGSDRSNTMSVYRHITRDKDLNGKCDLLPFVNCNKKNINAPLGAKFKITTYVVGIMNSEIHEAELNINQIRVKDYIIIIKWPI